MMMVLDIGLFLLDIQYIVSKILYLWILTRPIF